MFIKEKLIIPTPENNNDFRNEKEIILNSLHCEENIKDLITKINQLSFLYTTESCGGHTITRESIKEEYPDAEEGSLQLPPENKIIYQTGEILFKTDRSAQSEIFINRLKTLITQFENTELFDLNIKKSSSRGDLPYTLSFSKNTVCDTSRQVEELKTEEEKFKLELEKLINEFM